MPLDVGSFEKIRAFVKEFKAKNQPLNILINNAGVKTLSPKVETQTGFCDQSTSRWHAFL